MAKVKKDKWKDVTTYSRDEKEREPRSFSLVAGSVRLVVTRKHGFDPDVWYVEMHVQRIGFDFVPAGADLEHAKRKCLNRAKRVLREALEAVEAVDRRGDPSG